MIAAIARTQTARRPRADARLDVDAEVIIVGAGFGGLGVAIALRRAGIRSFIVLERAAEVGGTWRDNVYPGCACDVPAMLYSFSFTRRAAWTRIYPQQAEILAYLKRTAAKQRLRERIRFKSELASARFDDAAGIWTVVLTDGATLRARVLVSAMGPLNRPKFPDIPGREMFAGPSFHSSAWDHSVELGGKNVVVIGTGASAIQFIPQIAPRVGRLTIVQRTPPWIIARNDKRVAALRQAARTLVPTYAWFVRKAIYWMLEIRALGFVVNPKILEAREHDVRKFIAKSVADPVLRAKVTPEYRAGCKRILVSDDYYPAIQLSNVELLTDRVTEIREHSVVTSDGREIPADVIIYGTGFRATDGIAPVRIYGSGGQELEQAWRDGMRAYLGTTIASFPNLFLVIGPNTGLGHNSMIFMMEAQYRYIVGAIRYLRHRKLHALDVRPDVMDAFNADLQRRMKRTVWQTGCSSWYLDARGKNVSLWPGFTFAFRRRTARFDPANYRHV